MQSSTINNPESPKTEKMTTNNSDHLGFELMAVSPIDGRYNSTTSELGEYFSEFALIRARVKIEIEYFLELSEYNEFAIELSTTQKTNLQSIYQNFILQNAIEIKETEKVTNHDVKAVEYFVKKKLAELELSQYSEMVHFGLTSEDVNNLAFGMCLRDSVDACVIPTLYRLYEVMNNLAIDNAGVPFLALTHGQTATPTTFGKEIGVFVYRLQRQINTLESIKLQGKFGGATGSWSAHHLALPGFDWVGFADKFVVRMGFEFNPITNQIIPGDSLAEVYHNLVRINNILIDFSRDIWMYVMRGILSQKKKEGEIGSSAMPHKINPINFENAEGNLGLANRILEHLADDLTKSRMQRDLTGSTVIRNQGVPIAHSIIAYNNLLKGLSRIAVDKAAMSGELENHWEVLAEGIQTVLRLINYPNPYEKLKELTRGQKITKQVILEFVESLDIDMNLKSRLLELTPQNYIGLSEKVVKEFLGSKM
jgi:adenylosuccinate lyase